MGIAGFPDIFQSKMLELIEDLGYVQAYLDDLLCISRSSLDDHLKKPQRGTQVPLQRGLKSQRRKINILRT
jgi:hypothetical protein